MLETARAARINEMSETVRMIFSFDVIWTREPASDRPGRLNDGRALLHAAEPDRIGFRG